MKINYEKGLVEFIPENAEETAKLQQIWRMAIDCNGNAKKLVPVGEFIPGKNHKGATFLIEGMEGSKDSYTPIVVDEDCRCYCDICNRFQDVKAGETIPICCGKLMEIIA